MSDCLFCKIAEGQIPSNKVYEDEVCFAFHDIDPQAPTHFLVIPKAHIGSVAEVTEDNAAVVAHIFAVISKVTKELGLDSYRVVSNIGEQAGLSHFREMLVDPNFIRAFKNTVLINLYNLAFGFTFNVFLALMINELKIKKVKPVVQTCVYLPYFLSWVIFAGLVQVFLEYPSSADIGGVVNQVISALGGQPVDFLKNPAMFRTILVITNIIKTAGYSTIVYLAAISGIDPALYESAAIDGANRKDMLLHITIPRILPSVMIMLILQLASLFISNFDQVYNLYNNYVLSTGDVLSTYIYRISLGGSGTNFELSTAMNLVLNTMGLIVVLGANKFVEKLDVQGIF